MAEIPEPSVQERVIAFVDVLGFRALVQRAFADDDELLKRLHRMLRVTKYAVFASSDIPELEILKRVMSPYLQATAFSDSIIISDAWEGGALALDLVASSASLLSSLLLQEGILCRGAIAKGRAIHDEHVVLGTGVVAAYELERQVAVFPRIVIADDLVSEAERLTLCRVKTDSDGFRFIDAFYQFSGVHQVAAEAMLGKPRHSAVPQVDSFAQIRAIVMQGLTENEKPSILVKYRWLARQFNEAVRAYVPGQVEPIQSRI